MDSTDSVAGAIYGAIGLAIGAKAVYFLTKLPKIIAGYDLFRIWLKTSPLEALDYAFGGMVFYGGLIGFALGVWRYSHHFRVPLICFVESYTPLIPFVHGMGRIGCFFAGCCFGVEYHGPLAVQFPVEAVGNGAYLVPRFPVQLLEAGLNFIVAAFLFVLQKRCGCDVRDVLNNSGNDKKMVPGKLLGIYLAYYIVFRFGIEFLRGDVDRGVLFGFISTSQIISILLIPVAVWLLKGGLMKSLKKKNV